MVLEKQTSVLPTNKATVASVLSPVIMLYAQPVVEEIWPQIAPTLLTGPATTTFVAVAAAAVASLLAVWFVPDQAGIPQTDVD